LDASSVGFSFGGPDIFFGRMSGPLMIGADFNDGIEFRTEYYLDALDAKRIMKVLSRSVSKGEKKSVRNDMCLEERR
jgi:hypothetical protein